MTQSGRVSRRQRAGGKQYWMISGNCERSRTSFAWEQASGRRQERRYGSRLVEWRACRQRKMTPAVGSSSRLSNDRQRQSREDTAQEMVGKVVVL